jgi:P-loop Domain of unknown function (DUF2791)
VLAGDLIAQDDAQALAKAVDELLERRLAGVARTTPALRAYWKATGDGDQATAQALLAWIGGQPNVSAAARRAAGVKGDLDHFAALGFLQGLLTILRDSGHPGLLLVLDEIETLQRVRSDVRDKGLNALRQLVDDVDSGRFPGLYLLITGTPAFYDGPQGVTRLTPLAQRLATDFGTDPRFDSPRAVQLRLTGFDLPKLAHLGSSIRNVYTSGLDGAASVRIDTLVDDAYIADLATAVAGELGGQVGVAPRVFLRKLVADVLDRVAEFGDFDLLAPTAGGKTEAAAFDAHPDGRRRLDRSVGDLPVPAEGAAQQLAAAPRGLRRLGRPAGRALAWRHPGVPAQVHPRRPSRLATHHAGVA